MNAIHDSCFFLGGGVPRCISKTRDIEIFHLYMSYGVTKQKSIQIAMVTWSQVLWVNPQVLWVNPQVSWVNPQVSWVNPQVLWVI